MLAAAAQTPRRHEPVRTCAGCRRKDAPAALLRLAVRDEPPYVAPDVGRRLGGRGVSVHPTRPCVRAAVERGGLARALRRPVPIPSEELIRMASEQYLRRAEGLLSSAHRAGRTAVGTDAVREAMGRGRVALLVVATDASNRRDELEQQAQRLGGSCAVLGTKASLGRVFGRSEVALVGVTEPALADEIATAAERLQCLADRGGGEGGPSEPQGEASHAIGGRFERRVHE